MEHVTLFGLVELLIESTAGGTLTLSTDMPGNAMAVRETRPIPITTTRRVVRLRLQGTTKGHLYSVRVTPAAAGVIRLYGGRIWARALPSPEWSWYQIPIPETSEEWKAVPLPIPPTSEEWTRVSLPIAETPANPEWVDIPVDE